MPGSSATLSLTPLRLVKWLGPTVITNLGPRQTQCTTIAEGDRVRGEEAAGALIAEARRPVRPLDLAARRLAEGGLAALMTDALRNGTMAALRHQAW